MRNSIWTSGSLAFALFLSFGTLYAADCPLVSDQPPQCGSGVYYTCDGDGKVWDVDSWGPNTWSCGQCLGGVMPPSENNTGCCGDCPVPNTGTINISSNIAASWSVTGPANFGGSGTADSLSAMPVGSYTITWGAVGGYTAPSSQSFTLFDGGTISFSGTYVVVSPPSVNINFSSLFNQGSLVLGKRLHEMSLEKMYAEF